MTLQEFISANNNKGVDVDKAFGDQCWDVGAAYCRDVIGVPGPYLPTVGGAVRTSFENFPGVLSQFFDKVVNNPNDPHQVPPAGSLVFWGTYVGPNGDVAICVDPKSGQLNFTAFCQNAPVGEPARLMSRSYRGVIGWLVPKSLTPPAPQPKPAQEVQGWAPANKLVEVTAPTLHVRTDATTDAAAGAANTPDGNLHAGDVIHITGWKYGQPVNGNNIWLRSDYGHWFWSGGTNYHG